MDEEMQGKVLGIPGEVVDRLRAVEAFKPAQGWGLYRRPAMLMRSETLEYAKMMDSMETDSIRRVIVGERGSGKTTMLLQAMTLAFLKGWVVINIPEGMSRLSHILQAFLFLPGGTRYNFSGDIMLTILSPLLAQDLTIAQTAYAPVSTTLPTTYIQKTYIANLLRAIQRANPILETLHVTQSLPQAQSSSTTSPSSSPQQPTLPPLTPGSTPLSHLCTLGSSDPEIAWPLFQHLTHELFHPASSSSPHHTRPPTLITLDSLAHAMTLSHYRSADFAPIHAHDLSLINWFTSLLSGSTTLANGGIVLAATSASNSPPVPSLDLALRRLENPDSSGGDPFKKYDRRVLDVFESGNVGVQRLGGVDRAGVRGLLEYWAQSGVMGARVDEGRVGEEWVLSGGGCVGELERGCVTGRVGYIG